MRPHRPLRDYVSVDAAVTGCPMENDEFLRTVACLLNGDKPELVTTPVCAECRLREQECLILASRLPCAGPVTTGGCKARCPSLNVPCIGCRGPVDDANFESMETILTATGLTLEDIRRRLHTFTAPAPTPHQETRK
jgi:sulfhydrogenase subunit delta